MSTQPTESQSLENPEGVEVETAPSTEPPLSLEGSEGAEVETAPSTEPPPSYVKLAMRNMVRKRGTSLYHFTLTTLGLLGLLVGLAYLTR